MRDGKIPDALEMGHEDYRPDCDLHPDRIDYQGCCANNRIGDRNRYVLSLAGAWRAVDFGAAGAILELDLVS